MVFRDEWATRIRTARKAANLSQGQLARLLDMNPVQVSRWERGYAIPNDESRYRLARALGTSVADLFPYPDQANGGEGEAA